MHREGSSTVVVGTKKAADAVLIESHIATSDGSEGHPMDEARNENNGTLCKGVQSFTSFFRHLLDTPNCETPLSIFDMLRRCIFVAGLAASAEAFQPVGAARVRGASFAPTPTWRRASPAVALELRGEHAKSAWRLASENPRPVLPRPCVRRATVSATQLGFTRTAVPPF